jgi:hypothetical protein
MPEKISRYYAFGMHDYYENRAEWEFVQNALNNERELMYSDNVDKE